MKYDDASWHYGGDFPEDLRDNAGATHIAMFAAWAALNGLAGEYHILESADDLSQLSERRVTPGEWFWRVSDGKLTDEDLSDVGNRFAATYYATGAQFNVNEGSYLADYDATFPSAESLYHVPDSWTTFDALRSTIDQRYNTWLMTR